MSALSPLKYFTLTLILIVSPILNFTNVALADIKDWQKGASIVPTSENSFFGDDFKQSLQNLKNDNANYVDLVIPLYQSSVSSSEIRPGGDTPTDASIINAIDTAHALGLKVGLTPHVELPKGKWRANIDPTNRSLWFTNYGNLMKKYAIMGEEHHAEQFIIGTELISLSADSKNPQNTALWRSLISDIRKVYSGSLTYAANWGPSKYGFDEKNMIKFWDALDYVGIDAYYPIGTDPNNTSVEYFKSYWASIDRNDIQTFAKRVNKPILFTEIGYRSTRGAHVAPYDYAKTRGVDLVEQSNAYEALLSYWSDKSYIKGVHIWAWSPDPNAGGILDTSYTPQNKPAEAVIKRWFSNEGLPLSFNKITFVDLRTYSSTTMFLF